MFCVNCAVHYLNTGSVCDIVVTTSIIPENPRSIPDLSPEWSAQGQVFHCKHSTKAPVLPKGRSSTENSGTKVALLLGMNRCGSIPLLSAPHSLFNVWTDLKRSEKIPGAPSWRCGEWIWLTGPSRLHRNSLQVLHISSIKVFDQIRDLEIPINLRPPPIP